MEEEEEEVIKFYKIKFFKQYFKIKCKQVSS